MENRAVMPAVRASEPITERQLRSVHIRPIHADDWRRLQRFHERLSPQTVELRFHGAKKHLSMPLAHRFTNVDGVNEAAVVATTGTRGCIVGVARYIRMDDRSAEVAFVVEDRYQRHHVGHRLLRRLCKEAWEHGIEEFVAEILPGNVPMFRLLGEIGSVSSHYAGGCCTARVRLTPDCATSR